MLFEIDAVLLAAAGIVIPLLLHARRDAHRQAVAEAAAKLTEAGLQASGDLPGRFVARPVGRDDIILSNGTRHMRPGASNGPRPMRAGASMGDDACVVMLGVPLVDQIVCRATEADAVMGPLPAVPRVHTGYAPFDQAYAVFVGPVGAAPSDGSYRAAAVASHIPWAQPALLDRLQELGLTWLRVHAGRAELVFPRLEIEDVGRAARIALAFEHAAHGRQAPPLVPGPRTPGLPTIIQGWGLGAAALILGLCVSPFTGLVGGVLLASILGTEGVDEELACGPGRHLVWVHVGRGSSLSCFPFGESSTGLYYFAWMLLVAALTALLGAALSALVLRDARRARAAAERSRSMPTPR